VSDEPKKKPSALIAIAFGSKKKGAEGESDEAEEGTDGVDPDAEGQDAAADEVWDAMQGKDKDAFKDALRRYVKLCMSDSDDYEAEES